MYCLNKLRIVKTPIAAAISQISQTPLGVALYSSNLYLPSGEPKKAEVPYPAAHGPFHRLIGSQQETCLMLILNAMLFLLLLLYY